MTQWKDFTGQRTMQFKSNGKFRSVPIESMQCGNKLLIKNADEEGFAYR